jgi:DegV family protein with EDD domain
MLEWLIIADSSCDMRTLHTGSKDIGFATIPFLIRMNQVDYEDCVDLRSEEIVNMMEQADHTCTACPSPEMWADAFRQAKNVVAITISSNLSGSYDSAMLGRLLVLEEDPDRNIYVVDSKSTGPKLAMLVQAILCQIKAKQSFDTICEMCNDWVESIKTLFVLSRFQNLVKNGRMPKIIGVVANQLGIHLLGDASPEGKIHVIEPLRGERRVLKALLAHMEKSGFNGVSAVISYCLNEQSALQLRDMIMEKWQNAVVQLLPTRGLDSYYAERNGLILAFGTC